MMEKYNEKFKNHFPNFDTDKKYSIVIGYDMSIQLYKLPYFRTNCKVGLK